MGRQIAVANVCLLLGALAAGGGASTAYAQTPIDEGAPASVELSLSVSPAALMFFGSMQLPLGTSGAGLGSLGGLLLPQLDVGIALDRTTFLVLGVAGAFHDGATPGFSVNAPLGLLWYLEPPRVGQVMPMLRIGLMPYATHEAQPPGSPYAAIESYGAFALVRGGITWLPDRHLAVRAEVGLRGGAGTSQGPTGALDGASGSLGMDALVGVVLRV